MAFVVKLYVLDCDPEVVDKTNYLSNENEISGVLLQDAVDVSTPYVELDHAVSINPGSGKASFWTANYCYIAQLHRYFFITGKEIIDNDHFVVRLETDVLMTYRTTIKGTTFFVDRNENAGSWLLPDANIPMSSEQTTSKTPLNFTPFSPGTKPNASTHPKQCRFLFLAAVGPIDPGITVDYHGPDEMGSFHTGQTEACLCYALNQLQALALCRALCNGDLDTWQADNTSAVFSLKAYPFDLDVATGYGEDNMLIGKVTTSSPSLKGYFLDHIIQTFASSGIQLPAAVDFRAASGDAKYQIHLPYLGFKELDPAVVADRPYIKVEYKINVLTGVGICRIFQNRSGSSYIDTECTAVYEFVAGAEVPLSFTNAAEIQRNQVSTVAGAALSILGAVATKNPALVGGAVAGAAGSIGNAIMTPVKTTMSGSMSGYAADLEYQNVYVLSTVRKSPILDDETQKTRYAARFGKMYQKSTALSSLTGRTVVTKFEMEMPSGCTTTEFEMIRQRLAEGVIL